MGIGHCPRKPSLRAGWPRAILFHECFHPRRRCSSEVTACLGVCSEPCRGTPGTAGVCAFSPPSEAGPSILRACLRGLPTWTGHDLGGTRLTARRKGSQGPVWECQCRPGWGGSPGGGPSGSGPRWSRWEFSCWALQCRPVSRAAQDQAPGPAQWPNGV